MLATPIQAVHASPESNINGLLEQIRELRKQLEELQKEEELIFEDDVMEVDARPRNEYGLNLSPEAEVVKNGENKQVSTVFGTGADTSSNYAFDNVKKLQLGPNGDVYYLEGDPRYLQLKKFNGSKNELVYNIMDDKLMRRQDRFISTGLGIIEKNIYIADVNEVYQLEGGRLQTVSHSLASYMKKNSYVTIWRMRKIGDTLYLMFKRKGHYHTYGFAELNPKTGKITQILKYSDYNKPYNFYIDKTGKYIFVAENRYVTIETLFPRKKSIALDTNDNKAQVMDVWLDEDRNLFYSVQSFAHAYIGYRKKTKEEGYREYIAGAYRGYVDGIGEQVEMDAPQDFVWDDGGLFGTGGYIFADTTNNVIRKLWINRKPEQEL